MLPISTHAAVELCVIGEGDSIEWTTMSTTQEKPVLEQILQEKEKHNQLDRGSKKRQNGKVLKPFKEIKKTRRGSFLNQPSIGDCPQCAGYAVFNLHVFFGVQPPPIVTLSTLCQTNDDIGTAPQTLHFGKFPKPVWTSDVGTMRAAMRTPEKCMVVLFREFSARAQKENSKTELRPDDSVIHYALVHAHHQSDENKPTIMVRNALVPLKGNRGSWGFGDRVFDCFTDLARTMLQPSEDLLGNSLPRAWIFCGNEPVSECVSMN